MTRSTPSLRSAGTTLGYGLLGVVVTAVVGLIVLNMAEPTQAVVYDLFYLRMGPSGATEVAILAHFILSGVVALGVTMLAADLLSDRGANLRAVGAGLAAMLVLVLTFLVIAFVGLAAFLTVLLVLTVAFVAVPLLLRYHFGMRSGAVPAFVGGIPVIVLLLLLAGFGIGWGWGYVVTAEEIPESAVDGPVVDFDEVSDVQDDLLTDDCSGEERRRCRLQLRDYEHERAAARFMADQGVRCPYQNGPSGEQGSFVVEHEGTHYQVTCSPHGD